MNDFRVELYNKYVSNFKDFISNNESIDLNSIFKLYKKRYLKLIEYFPKDASILDIGCGSGLLLSFLKSNGFTNTYGIDISKQQLTIAKSRGLNVDEFNLFDFFNSNKKKYDIIFAMDIIEHFYKNELIDLFESINNLLNENGVLIIHTPNGDGLFPNHIIYGDLTHLTIFNPNSLLQILKSTGFDKVQFYETGPTSKNFIGVIRLAFWHLIKIVVKSIRIIETGRTEQIITQDFICLAKKKNDFK